MAKITVRPGSGKQWHARYHEGMEEFGGHVSHFADMFGMSEWEFVIKFASTKGFLAQVDFENCKYHSVGVEVSTLCLDSEVGGELQAAALHEVLHVVLYPYTRLAARFEKMAVNNKEAEERPLGDELDEREEEVVTVLEKGLIAQGNG